MRLSRSIIISLQLVLFLTFATSNTAQSVKLNYYLPNIEYKTEITTPEQFLGHQIGDWHITHDQLYYYMKQLASESDRIMLNEYARSHENRPLVYLTITSGDNHKNINNIKLDQQNLCNPDLSDKVDIDNSPIIIYQGYSIHGNESSGANAAALVAYYLAAANDKHIKKQLNETVILLDPCYNPDGLNRFANWVNTHKSKNLISNTDNAEHNEPWPRGRTNHYWTDLNRDWLLLTHPESRGRVAVFHDWKPSILTDHHEMSSNSTFFFQPGIPSRTNPNTPQKNQNLTEDIAKFHAAALDSIGSMYYTKESFDDFYYGKGSTYPDINGAVGILFEQASSRGHLRSTVHGEMSFPFTIRNQVATSLSTQKAGLQLRKQMLEYKREFFKNATVAAKADPTKAYVFTSNDDAALSAFIEVLSQHQIDIFTLDSDVNIDNKAYKSEDNSYIIPTDQQQYKLIKTMFDRVTSFKDSLFYDVSAWTFPLAYDLQYSAIGTRTINSSMIGDLVTSHNSRANTKTIDRKPYGYMLDWSNTMSGSILYDMQSKGIKAKLITQSINKNSKGTPVDKGTIWIASSNQRISETSLMQQIQNYRSKEGVKIAPIYSGLNQDGVALGSPKIKALNKPAVALLIGDGVNAYDAGDIWFYLDQRMDIPVVLLNKEDISPQSLKAFNRLIIADGRYNDLSDSETNSIKDWINNGGTVIAIKSAINWLNSRKIISQARKTNAHKNHKGHKHSDQPYESAEKRSGSKRIGGSIFNTTMDMSHPLSFGYQDDQLALMKRGTTFYEGGANPYSNPIRYTKNPLLSGYMHKDHQESVSESAMLTVHGVGNGSVICFADNPLFRGYWWGGFKLFNNALFFADIISSRTTSEDEHGH